MLEGISVTGPSLILAVAVPLKITVELFTWEEIETTKLVTVCVCPALPLSLTFSNCVLKDSPPKA
jgi:hypothetical protein